MTPMTIVYNRYEWVKRCIESCETQPQIYTCNKLIDLFRYNFAPTILFGDVDRTYKRRELVNGLVEKLRNIQKEKAQSITRKALR